ncbi:hypothetical protein [Microbacterium terrisoli]|uniref:hypothetical protein n=1 Tax=Microbacterium terrisoli TaxID=3242192 RepID=UPI0028039FB0|nr:hypothetical protein [Microbacterium protaetiae]
MPLHRPMPAHKTEGTAYNLHPATRATEAQRLRHGDVIVPEPGCPVVITALRRKYGGVNVTGRYIWQAAHETAWSVGRYPLAARVAVALPGEYPHTHAEH